jgi:hypothetical protein
LKSRKFAILMLAALVSLNIPAAFSATDIVSVEYTFEQTVNGCSNTLVKDTQLQEIPGEPVIPYKVASILLPQNAQVKDVKVKHGTPIVQKGFDLPWGQPPCTYSDTPVTVGRNEEIYNSDSDYPGNLLNVVSVESFRGFQILLVNLYPVQYLPKSQTVKFYETMTVEVQFGKETKNKLYRGLPDDKQDVLNMVDNPEVVETYEDNPSPLATEEYIIITDDTMQSTFQMLANYKANYVNGATVYTVSWITSNYSGIDNAEKVRNFIIDKYTNNGLKYVLLGGDVAAVPYRGFYVSTGGYTDSDMLADMYFGHLDGSHNSDGDGYWGETTDGVDFGAEVAVGRAPCQSTTEAQNFVNKVIAYEQMNKPKRVLLHQSRVQTGNVPDARCLAYNCDDYIPGDYVIDYVFEEDSGGVSKSRWISQWAANPVAVAHIGHGNTNVYYINYEKDIGTVSWYNSDVASMTNTFWPWTTSVACITGQIEANDCLAEAYVMDANNGAIAAIYNDNYGWFSTLDACMYSGEFCEMEFRACWSDGMQKLGDMLNKARSYLASSAQSNSTYRWCFYERNLIGDPESPTLTSWPPPPDTVIITYPPDGAWLSGTINITVSTTGCIDTVEFYINGVLKYTDKTAPFAYLWDTTAYSEGSHTISVKGYCDGVFKYSDTVTIKLSVPPPPIIVITSPQEGDTVSDNVLITINAYSIDTVKFYIDGKLKDTDKKLPFEYTWKTKGYKDGTHTIRVEGYYADISIDSDQITVIVENKSSIGFFSFVTLFLFAGIAYRRR